MFLFSATCSSSTCRIRHDDDVLDKRQDQKMYKIHQRPCPSFVVAHLLKSSRTKTYLKADQGTYARSGLCRES